jgi:hypothetical protein
VGAPKAPVAAAAAAAAAAEAAAAQECVTLWDVHTHLHTRTPGAAGTLQVHGNSIKLLTPKPLDFEGFSWVAGPQSSQDDIMTRECGQPCIQMGR